MNPGNSGGALIASDGTLIGVIVARDPSAEGIGYAVAAPTVASFLDGETISGSLPFPFTPGESEEEGGDSSVDVLPPLLALVAGGALLAGTSRWRARKRTRRRIDPDVILHSRSGGGHGQP